MNNLKPSQIVIIASGAVMFLFSFFSFLKFEGFGDESWNAWSGDAGTLFMATWPALFGLIAAGITAAVLFGNVKVPDRILTFSLPQVLFILAFTSFIIMLGYLLGGGIPDGIDRGFGMWLMLLGSIGLLAGTVMELMDSSTGTTRGPSSPSGPATPF